MPPESVPPTNQDRVTDSAAAWDDRSMFALDADVTVYWPDVRPCYEEEKSDE